MAFDCNMQAATAGAVALGDIAKEIHKTFGLPNELSQKRDVFTQAAKDHLRKVFPKKNVLIVDNKWVHMMNFHPNNNGFHVELKRSGFGTHGFNIYVFDHGLFTKGGDGGYDNWCFGGNFTRNPANPMQVTFHPIP